MGFLSAFANLGSVGSTTKWAIKGYQSFKSENNDLKPNDEYSSHWTDHIHSFIGRVKR